MGRLQRELDEPIRSWDSPETPSYLLGLDFSRPPVRPAVPSVAFTSWTVLTCGHERLNSLRQPHATLPSPAWPGHSLVRPLRSSSCEAGVSAEAVSDSDGISLVKLEGNMPVFPFRSPSHQPSSTWRSTRRRIYQPLHRPTITILVAMF